MAFHEPYYSTDGGHPLAAYFQQNLEDVLYDNAVDLVVTGHVHAYERSFPTYKGQVSPSRCRRARSPSKDSRPGDPDASWLPFILHSV